MKQTVSFGAQARAVDAALDRLQSQRFIQRLWQRDASLWSSDAQTQAAIRNRLGWLGIAEVMAGQVDELRAFTNEIRDAGFTHALLLGMGGSGLFSEVCRETIGISGGHLQLTVLDTTDPSAVQAAQQQCPLQQLLVIISSKSGATAEVSALSTYFYELFRGITPTPGDHCVAVTDVGTPLEGQAKAWRCRRLFTHGPASGGDVGGRFSALTFFGLVPSSLMGVDVATLLQRAQQMYRQCGAETRLQGNPAAVLGAALGAFAARGRDKLTVLCSSELASFGTWVEQLIAENLGKQGKGIVPIVGEPLRSPSAYGSDRVFVELQRADHVDAALGRHAKALADAGHPVIQSLWDDRYDLGGEVAKWTVASVITGAMLQINPFDEPNVQESKERTNALLSAYASARRLPEEPPLCAEGGMAVYGSVEGGAPRSVDECVTRLLGRIAPTGYIAVLSFLPRSPSLDRGIQALRTTLAGKLPNAAMVQFGPRYLHSTGQLFKGGPATGVFLLLTADDPVDLPIPGGPVTFSVLKQAQALGDFQAMREKGRQILRVHLRGDLKAGLARLLDAIKDPAVL